MSSWCILQISHKLSVMIFCWTRFALVGKEFVQARQTRFLTLLGTSRPHIFFHKGFMDSVFDGPGCSSCKNLYPDLTEYSPFELEG